MTDGSALRIGVVKCSGSLNLGSKGSLLNSALLRYASPMDLVTWLKVITHLLVNIMMRAMLQLVIFLIFLCWILV